MFRNILKYGVIAGLFIGSASFVAMLKMAGGPPPPYSMVLGYTTMLIGLSAVFVGANRYRDDALGGVIRFWPAFGMDLAISFIAGVFYVLAWQATLAVTNMDFAGDYSKMLIAQQKAKGISAEALAKFVAEMEVFKTMYANPLLRLPMTFVEIFPVGVLVSLVTAGLLRNSRFLPMRRT